MLSSVLPRLGESQLLTNDLATRKRVESELELLSACKPDDFLVIAYAEQTVRARSARPKVARQSRTHMGYPCQSPDRRLSGLHAEINGARQLILKLNGRIISALAGGRSRQYRGDRYIDLK